MAKVTVTITDEEGKAGSNLNIQTVFSPPIQHKDATPAQSFAVELMQLMTTGILGRAHGPWKASKPTKKAVK